MDWFAGAWAVFEKDLRLEFRNRYAINALALFVASTLLLTAFSVAGVGVDAPVASALMWIVIVFASAVGLARAFVAEEEQGTVLLLRLHAQGSIVYAGKLLFNILLIGAMNLLAVTGFIFVLGISVDEPALLVCTLALGSIGLAGVTTLLSAIIARTSARGPLMAVLAFPLMVPLLLSAIQATQMALTSPPAIGAWSAAVDDVVALFAYSGAVITASVLLFDYVWND